MKKSSTRKSGELRRIAQKQPRPTVLGHNQHLIGDHLIPSLASPFRSGLWALGGEMICIFKLSLCTRDFLSVSGDLDG